MKRGREERVPIFAVAFVVAMFAFGKFLPAVWGESSKHCREQKRPFQKNIIN